MANIRFTDTMLEGCLIEFNVIFKHISNIVFSQWGVKPQTPTQLAKAISPYP
jgi:hypothetical protein